jgi:hypothetical protein
MSLPRDSRKWEASVVAEPWDMVEPVERQRDMPAAPRAGLGRESGAGEPLRGMAGWVEGAAISDVGHRLDAEQRRNVDDSHCVSKDRRLTTGLVEVVAWAVQTETAKVNNDGPWRMQ